jgi:hypothetical protein
MSSNPGNRDIDIVVHLVLATALVVADACVLLFAVPALFDRHRTELDLAALLLVTGSLAFSYLAGRYLWRSARHCIGGGDQ